MGIGQLEFGHRDLRKLYFGVARAFARFIDDHSCSHSNFLSQNFSPSFRTYTHRAVSRSFSSFLYNMLYRTKELMSRRRRGGSISRYVSFPFILATTVDISLVRFFITRVSTPGRGWKLRKSNTIDSRNPKENLENIVSFVCPLRKFIVFLTHVGYEQVT